MGRMFVADPEQIRLIGNKILDEANQFKQNYEKIFTTVNEMVASDYLSPDARVLAEVINSRRQELSMMYNTMLDYGNYCLKTSNSVIRNIETNISNIRGGAV